MELAQGWTKTNGIEKSPETNSCIYGNLTYKTFQINGKRKDF